VSNIFSGTGNIGRAPELRMVDLNGRVAKVLELRVFFDAYKTNPQTNELEQDDSASFWKNVTIWNDRAERASKFLVKGARVHVTGYLKGERWTDKDSGTERFGEYVVADDVFLSFARVASVTFREKAQEGSSEGAE